MSLGNAVLAQQDYPLLDVFWTMLEFFVFILWIFLIIRVLGDLFRSPDLSGWGKAAWVIFVIVVPFLGVFVYLIARGGNMHNRDIAVAQQQEEAFKLYAQQAAGGSDTADELSKLAALRDQGALTEAEFAAQKAKILG